jgi:hypothetical protein
MRITAAIRAAAAPAPHNTTLRIEGEPERSEQELGHGLPVSPTSRPVAIDGPNAADFGLFGSTQGAESSMISP